MRLQHSVNKMIFGKYNLIYLNINSLLNKIDELETTINILNNNKRHNVIHLIALTETRLHDYQIQYFNMQNYTAYYCTRQDGYGGCALFVHASLNSNLIEKNSTQNVEILTVKVVELDLNVMVVYKQPLVNNDVFNNILQTCILDKRKMITIGDMNVDLLKNSNSTRHYIDLLTSNGQVILNKINANYAARNAFRKDRVGDNISESKTIIDHIATDCLNYSFNFSIVESTMSDHMQLVLSFDNHKYENFASRVTTENYTTLKYNDYSLANQNYLVKMQSNKTMVE